MGTGEWKKSAGSFKPKLTVLPIIEILLGIYMAICTVLAVLTKSATGTIPFLVIFSFGYLYVGFLTIHSRWISAKAQAQVKRETVAEAEALAA